MSAPMRRRLVVDADVLYGAGQPGTPSDSGARRTKFLNAVLTICHHAVVSTELGREWEEHASKVAVEWWAPMVSWSKTDPPDALSGDDSLKERVLATTPTAAERAIMEKDWHLILAALQSDGLIVSCERKARRHFHRAARDVPELSRLVWVDPHEDDILEWLREGAPTVPERCLGYQP